MKTIGLIGGMSWESSLVYFRLINEGVREKLGGLHSAKCIMHSVDFAEIEPFQHEGKWERQLTIHTPPMAEAMPNDIFFKIHTDLPREGPGRDRYTAKAFQMLPKLESPRILDIGCGPGGPTLELARLSRGHVIGIDIHQPYLDRLSQKIKEEGLSDRVEAVNCSMFEMTFSEENFDMIWAEGSIYLVGFERGLKEWRRYIKPKGFLVVHEMTWLRPEPPHEICDYWKELYPGIKTVAENVEPQG